MKMTNNNKNRRSMKKWQLTINNEEKNKPLKLREKTIEEVDEFTYLGSILQRKMEQQKMQNKQ
jgi:hypothetical protein